MLAQIGVNRPDTEPTCKTKRRIRATLVPPVQCHSRGTTIHPLCVTDTISTSKCSSIRDHNDLGKQKSTQGADFFQSYVRLRQVVHLFVTRTIACHPPIQ